MSNPNDHEVYHHQQQPPAGDGNPAVMEPSASPSSSPLQSLYALSSAPPPPLGAAATSTVAPQMQQQPNLSTPPMMTTAPPQRSTENPNLIPPPIIMPNPRFMAEVPSIKTEVSQEELAPLHKRPKTTEEYYTFEEVTFQPIVTSPRVGDVVTVMQVTRSEDDTTVNMLMPLYIRQHLIKKLKELKKKFEESTKLIRLYATGAPGCGKTCFFWMWALMKMQQGKSLLFVQCRANQPSIWILENNKVKRIKYPQYRPMFDAPKTMQEVANQLLQVVSKILNHRTKKYDYGILDGIVLPECNALMYVFTTGTGNKSSDIFSKSVFVTQVPYRKPHGYMPRAGIFCAILDMSFDSWKESDYLEAAESQFMVQSEITRELFLEEWKMLNTNGDSNDLPSDDEKIKQAIKLKYDYAGGNATYMFEFGVTDLERELNDKMQNVTKNQWEDFATNTVPSSLMQVFHHKFDTYCIPVSKYVWHRAYAVCGEWVAESVKEAAYCTKNPSLLGWASERAELNKLQRTLVVNRQDRQTEEEA